MRRTSTPAAAALVMAMGTAMLAMPARGQESTPAPAPDAQAQRVGSGVKGAVTKASKWTEAAIAWMAEKGTRLKNGADGKRDRLEQWLNGAVDDALALPPAPMGLRVLSAKVEEGKPLKWIGFDETPVRLPGRVVLLVHGLDEPGNVWDDLAPMLRERGHTVVRFDYADDQACAVSAAQLGKAAADLRDAGALRVDMICHSMGGLLARDVLTRPDLYAGDATGAAAGGKLPAVERLILLGVPNRGSGLARLRYVAEAREHFMRWIDSDGKDPRMLLGFLKDGAGEAGADLRPGSTYLEELNARALPRNVRITCVVGTLVDGELDRLRGVLTSNWLRKVLSDDEIARMEQALTSAAETLGDGVVTADSARLEGVDDTVMVEAMHRTLLKRPGLETALREELGEPRRVPSAVPVILDRLGDAETAPER